MRVDYDIVQRAVNAINYQEEALESCNLANMQLNKCRTQTEEAHSDLKKAMGIVLGDETYKLFPVDEDHVLFVSASKMEIKELEHVPD